MKQFDVVCAVHVALAGIRREEVVATGAQNRGKGFLLYYWRCLLSAFIYFSANLIWRQIRSSGSPQRFCSCCNFSACRNVRALATNLAAFLDIFYYGVSLNTFSLCGDASTWEIENLQACLKFFMKQLLICVLPPCGRRHIRLKAVRLWHSSLKQPLFDGYGTCLPV